MVLTTGKNIPCNNGKKAKHNLPSTEELHEQFSEIGDIQWLTVDECKSKIRVEHPTKQDIIHKLDEFMMNWNKDLILKE